MSRPKASPSRDDPYLSLSGAARVYNLARNTLRAAISRGELRGYQLGAGPTSAIRVRPHDVERWIESHGIPVDDETRALVERVFDR